MIAAFLIALVLATGAMAIASIYVEGNRAKRLAAGSVWCAFATFAAALTLKPEAYGVYVIAAIAACVPSIGGMS